MIRYLQLMLFGVLVAISGAVHAVQPAVLQTENVTIVFEPSLQTVADDVVRLYPKLRRELEGFLGWNFDINPRVVLISQHRRFQELSGHKNFVAYAIPQKNLVVIDHTRMNMRPFTLEITLKHELCHLFLHRYVNNRNLPKWLDEGVCQWVSDGIGELYVDKNWSGLDAAVMAGRVIPFRRLGDYFPRDRASLTLAYEQSKSFINYIDRQYGYGALLEILAFLKNGESIDYAVMGSLDVSLEQLEKEWLAQLDTTPRWLIFLASHIYAILFFLAAIMTMFGFIRLLIKRRRIYREWEEEDD
ncbi:MAG: peptidase MA family metallohydrolase [Desulfobacterales bacterium]|nr:peptidase MA family metallohydrolase [Desulfobacterales bacterium]